MRHDAFGLRWEVRNDTDKAIIQEVFAQKVYGDTIREGERVIDIGAQIGSFSIFAAGKGAKVLAYEPEPENYATLLENISLNESRYPISAFNEAVWKGKGEITLYSSCSENLGAHSVVFARDPEASVKVRATTLDEIFEKNGIEFCDFLKIDCEGSEFEILKSTKHLGDIGEIAMEVHGFATNEKDYLEFRAMLAEHFDLRGGEWHPVINYLHGTKKK